MEERQCHHEDNEHNENACCKPDELQVSWSNHLFLKSATVLQLVQRSAASSTPSPSPIGELCRRKELAGQSTQSCDCLNIRINGRPQMLLSSLTASCRAPPPWRRQTRPNFAAVSSSRPPNVLQAYCLFSLIGGGLAALSTLLLL